jgi:peptidyl-prolyl cis-trans isomerase SurA
MCLPPVSPLMRLTRLVLASRPMKMAGAVLVAASLMLASPGHAADGPVLVDRLLVVVQGSPVFRSEVQKRLRPYVVRFGDKPIDPENRASLEREMLDRIVDERILARDAKKLGIVVSDADIEAAMLAIAGQSHASPKDLIEEARRIGLSEADYRDEIRRQLTDARWVFRLVPDPKKRQPQELERERSKVLKDLRAKTHIEVLP